MKSFLLRLGRAEQPIYVWFFWLDICFTVGREKSYTILTLQTLCLPEYTIVPRTPRGSWNHYSSVTQIPETTKQKCSLIQTLRFLIKHFPLFSVQTVPGTNRSHSLSPYSTSSIIKDDDSDNCKYLKEKHWKKRYIRHCRRSFYPVGYFLWTDFSKRMLQHGTEI